MSEVIRCLERILIAVHGVAKTDVMHSKIRAQQHQRAEAHMLQTLISGCVCPSSSYTKAHTLSHLM